MHSAKKQLFIGVWHCSSKFLWEKMVVLGSNRIVQVSFWTDMQGSGHAAVIELPQMTGNVADLFKRVLPKGLILNRCPLLKYGECYVPLNIR